MLPRNHDVLSSRDAKRRPWPSIYFRNRPVVLALLETLPHCKMSRETLAVGCFSRCEASVQQLLGMEEGRNHCHKCDRPSSSSPPLPLLSSLLFSPNHIGSFRQEILPPSADNGDGPGVDVQMAGGGQRPTDRLLAFLGSFGPSQLPPSYEGGGRRSE